MWTYTTFPYYWDIYIWATYTYKFSPINASSSFFFNKTSNAPSTNFRKLRSPNRADSPHRFNPSVTTALNSITKTLALNCTLLTDLGRVQRLQNVEKERHKSQRAPLRHHTFCMHRWPLELSVSWSQVSSLASGIFSVHRSSKKMALVVRMGSRMLRQQCHKVGGN